MPDSERRRLQAPDPASQRTGLTPAQHAAIATLEQLGWSLRFVRRPMFRDPVPVLFQKGGERWIAVEGDGRLDENPDFAIRE